MVFNTLPTQCGIACRTGRWLLAASRRSPRALALCVCLCAAACGLTATPALASAGATWYVTTTADDGTGTAGNCSTAAPANPATTSPPCSLRDAFAAAQPGDTISVDLPSGTTGPVELTSALTLQGASNYPVDVMLDLQGASLVPDASITLEQYSLTVLGDGAIVSPANPGSNSLIGVNAGSVLTLDGPQLNVIGPDAQANAQAPLISVQDAFDDGSKSTGKLITRGGVTFTDAAEGAKPIGEVEGIVDLGATRFVAEGIEAAGGTIAYGTGGTTVSFDDVDFQLEGCQYLGSPAWTGPAPTITQPGTISDQSGTCLGASTSSPPQPAAVDLMQNTTDTSQAGSNIVIAQGAPLTLDAIVCPADSGGNCPTSGSPAAPAGSVRFGIRPFDPNTGPFGIGTQLGSPVTLEPGTGLSGSDQTNVTAVDGSLAEFTHVFSTIGTYLAYAAYIPASGVSAPDAGYDFARNTTQQQFDVVPEPAVTVTSAAGHNSGLCSDPSTTSGDFVSGSCSAVQVATDTNNGPNVYPGSHTLSLSYDDGSGNPVQQSSDQSGGNQTSSAQFAVMPDDSGGVLTGTFTGHDGVFGTSTSAIYLPGLKLASAKGAGTSACSGKTGDNGTSPVVGECTDEQLTLSRPPGSPSTFAGDDQVVITYTPASGPTQSKTQKNLTPGTIDFGVVPSASSGHVSATFTSPTGDFANFSTSAPFDATNAAEPDIAATVAKGQGSSLCSGASGSTTTAAYVGNRCSEVDVTVSAASGNPDLDPSNDTITVTPQDSGANQAGASSGAQTIPAGATRTATLAFALTPGSSATQLDVHYGSANHSNYQDEDKIIPVTVSPTPAPVLTITPSAGASDRTTCSGDTYTSTSGYVIGECSVVTVHLADASDDAGRPFDATDDAVTLTYKDGSGNQVSQHTANVDSSANATFAITPSTSAVDLTAQSTSGDGAYGDGAATTNASAGQPPGPAVSISVKPGSGSSVCASAPRSQSGATLEVGACSEVDVTAAEPAGAPAMKDSDSSHTVTLAYNDGKSTVAKQSTTVGNGVMSAAFAVTPPAARTVTFTGTYTNGGSSFSGSNQLGVSATSPASITITPAAGQGTSVCANAPSSTFDSSFVVNRCSAVTVTVTPQPGVPFDGGGTNSPDVVQFDYVTSGSSGGSKISHANLPAAGSVTFAVTPTASDFSLDAIFLSGDAEYYKAFSSDNPKDYATERESALAESTTCLSVTVSSPPVPTRVNGVLAQSPVAVTAVPQTQLCNNGMTSGVTYGGTYALTALPPAYETVTGFAVTTSTNTTTLPLSGSPGAGQPASASLQVTGPTLVVPITVQTPGTCPSLTLQQRWLGAGDLRTDLGSYSVTGAIGCSITAPVTTVTVPAGQSVTALPGTPLSLAANGATITKTTGKDFASSFSGLPSGASSSGSIGQLAMPAAAGAITANMQMQCLPQPVLEQSTGGTATGAPVPALSLTVGALADVLKTVPNGPSQNDRVFYGMSCPSGWGSGMLPGAVIGYKAVASTAGPQGAQVSGWGVEGFQELDSITDEPGSNALKAFLSTNLAPLNARSAPTTASKTASLTLPPGTGTAAEPAHPVAVGFQFTRELCEPVSTDASVTGRGVGGITVYGTQVRGRAISPVVAPKGQISVSPAPNCTSAGPNYYVVGTPLTVTTADPANLAQTTVTTEEQQPGTYTGTTDPDLYTGSAANTAAVARAAKARRRTAPARRRRPIPAPVRRPSFAPPAAPRVPDVRKTTNAAHAALMRAGRKVSASQSTAARLLTLVGADRRALTAALRTHRQRRELAGYKAWMTGLAHWWTAEHGVIVTQVAAAQAQLTQLQNVSEAAYAASGTGLTYDAYSLAGQQGRVRLEAAVAAAEAERSRLVSQMQTLLRSAVARHGAAQLQRALTGLSTLAKSLVSAAKKSGQLVTSQRAALAKSSARTSTRARRQLSSAVTALRHPPRAAPRWRGKRVPRRKVRHHLVARAASGRALYPDEWFAEATSGKQLVTMPLTYLGVYADSPSANTTTNATSGAAAIQSSKGHSATFMVGETPLGIHATWGPTSCQVPSAAYDSSKAAVSIDGGASACAGPGTVARLGTFSVNVQPFETAVPVVIVTGTNPNGAVEQRVQVGNAQTFPALANTSVKVQLCEPLEFGGAVTDTVGDNTLALDGSMIDQFASAPAGDECATPGYYKIGTKVTFALPSLMQQAVQSRTIENPSLHNGNCLYNETHGSPGECAQTLPAPGTADWEVDGVEAGTAPSVTLTPDDPQHEVGLELAVPCDRLEVDVRSNGKQAAKSIFNWSGGYYNYETGFAGPAMFDTASSCPVSPPDAGVSVATADSGDRGFPNYLTKTVGYYLPGDAVQLERPTNQGDTCRYEKWAGLQEPQPNDQQYPSGGLNGRQVELSGPLYAYLPAGSGGGVTLGDDWCGGYQFHASPPCRDVTCAVDGLINDDLLPALQSYVVNPAKVFYNRLSKLVTTNPITNPKAFFTQLGEAAALYVVSALPGGAAFVTAAGDSDFFSSPDALLNTLAQSGRLAAAQTVSQSFLYAQVLLNESGVGEVLAGADSVIELTAAALQKAGAPNSVVSAIRYGRALTNGLNAISTCSTSAAAGDTPPSKASSGTGLTIGKDAYGVFQAVQRYKEPTALKAAATALKAGGTLSGAARTYATGVEGKLNDTELGTVLAQVSVLHNFDGANVNWTPGDFASCLAANTYSLG